MGLLLHGSGKDGRGYERSLGAVLSNMVLISCANQLAPSDTVRDRDTAISIGRTDCGPPGIPQKSLDEGWHARLSGEYWNVWFGARDFDDAFMSVSVSKRDGKTTGCVITTR
jgi:hypothetical protein